MRGDQNLIDISLTQGYIAIIDDCDVEQTKYKWSSDIAKNGRIYAIRGSGNNRIRLHVAILQPPIGYEVDHIDRNGLNNLRSNLRIATVSQNRANCLPRKQRKFKGVYIDTRYGYITAKIQFNKQQIYLGRFNTELDAPKAYNAKAIELFGEFARLNQIDDKTRLANPPSNCF